MAEDLVAKIGASPIDESAGAKPFCMRKANCRSTRTSGIRESKTCGGEIPLSFRAPYVYKRKL